VSGQLHAPADLPPEKSPWYPLERRLCGPQSRSGRRGEVKNFDPTGTRNPTSRSAWMTVGSNYTAIELSLLPAADKMQAIIITINIIILIIIIIVIIIIIIIIIITVLVNIEMFRLQSSG
jgi:hypothetical protein